MPHCNCVLYLHALIKNKASVLVFFAAAFYSEISVVNSTRTITERGREWEKQSEQVCKWGHRCRLRLLVTLVILVIVDPAFVRGLQVLPFFEVMYAPLVMIFARKQENLGVCYHQLDANAGKTRPEVIRRKTSRCPPNKTRDLAR